MDNSFLEALYPVDFRKHDTRLLGEHLRLRHSVELVGMKRVGISNFLRFFLYHKGVVSRYINHGENHIFVPVDLNDLVERDLFPFWILTFKRLVDRVENSGIGVKTKKEISSLFLDSIQSQDLFITIESLRSALSLLVQQKTLPTLFFIRFDRITNAINQDFFANLQGLKDATNQKLSYVFTSFRSLDEIAPHVFSRKFLSVFSHLMYIKPANPSDMKIIFDTFEERYNISPSPQMLNALVALSGGHVQYLQLSLIILNQKAKERKVNKDTLLQLLIADERIGLQSEEIWESLSEEEQTILVKIANRAPLTDEDKRLGKYLFETGLVDTKTLTIFSPLFEHALGQKMKKKTGDEANDFTKKEHGLFTYLHENIGEICEREKIIETVWPEYVEYGVSDWTIDRLVARLRNKLKKQKNKYSIVTVKTRGYKLIEE